MGSAQGAGASENAILKALGSTGLFGGFFLIIFHLLALKTCKKIFKDNIKNSFFSNLNCFFALIIILLIFSSLFEGYMVEHFSLTAVLIILALLGTFRIKEDTRIIHY